MNTVSIPGLMQHTQPNNEWGSIQNLEPLPYALPSEEEENLPLFSQLIEQGLLPPGHALRPEQEQLIKTLFKHKALDSEICLIDLLGSEIHDRINHMLGAKDSEVVDLLRNQFSSLLFLIYAHFMRKTIWEKTPIPSQEIAYRLYGGGPNNPQFIKKLQKLKNDIIRAISNKQNEIRNHPTLLAKTKNSLTDGLQIKLTELVQYFDLFLELFQSPEASTILIDRTLLHFSGSFALANPNKPTSKDLKKYMCYIQNLFSSAIAERFFNFDLSQIFNILRMHNLDQIALEEIPAFQQRLLNALTVINDLQKENIRHLEQAEQGRLTHDGWLKLHNAPKKETKSHPEFVETLRKNAGVFHLATTFITDIQRICESQVFSERFPGDFIPNQLRHNRILVNSSLIAKSNTTPYNDELRDSNPVLHTIRKEAHSIFGILLEQIQQKTFIQNCAHAQLTTPKTNTQIDPKIPHAQTLFLQFDEHFLSSFDDTIQTLRDLNTTFPSRLHILTEKLQDILGKEPHLGTYTHAQIKEILYQEMSPFFPLLLLLKDVETLKGTISPLVSEELANFLALDGLTIPKIPETPSIMTSTKAPISSEKLKFQVEVSHEKPQEPFTPTNGATDPVLETRSRTTTSKRLPEAEKFEPQHYLKIGDIALDKRPQEQLRSRNVTDVMKRLEQLGFIEIRQKGSHHIYKRQDPSTQKTSGPIVVVPGSTGKEIPQGTLRSIESQINSALCTEGDSPHLT